MRIYIVATGIIFALLTLAHIWRFIVEPSQRTNPFFIVVTIISALMSLVAWRMAAKSAPKSEP
jgi:hypothetical protein